MIYTLKNDTLTVNISSRGTEIMSVYGNGCEYIWQGNPEFWASRAPILFPICGRLFGGKYVWQGKEYEMILHGFARTCEFDLVRAESTYIEFKLTSNEDTRVSYPFDFTLNVSYTLEGNTLKAAVVIKNDGNTVLPATFGVHPGFNVPLDSGSFEDWYIEFGEECAPNLLVASDACLNTGIKKAYPLKDNKILPLRHDLFDNDAIYMDRVSRSATLKSNKSQRFLTLKYNDMPYLCLWHKPRVSAPYVCIEPFCGLPSFDGITDDMATKNDMFHITPQSSKTVTYDIIFG